MTDHDQLAAKIDAQTRDFHETIRTLSGEHEIRFSELREAIALNGDAIRDLAERQDRTSDRTGKLERAQAQDDKAREAAQEKAKTLAMVGKIGKMIGFPILAALVSVAGWLASQWWHGYQERGRALQDHGEQIAVIKSRIDTFDEEADERQREILEALHER